MTKLQVSWASKHDWYVGTIRKSGNEFDVIVRDDDGDGGTTMTIFTNFNELYEWAGY